MAASPIDPYENQLIGAFLVALGYYGGQKNFPQPIRVNLQQQTPLDAGLGDLLVGAKRFFAIEFKRTADAKALRDEAQKWQLDAYIKWFTNTPRAKRAPYYHLLASSEQQGGGEIVAGSYPHFLANAAMGEMKFASSVIDAGTLIKELYEPSNYGGEPHEVLNYLQFIARFRRKMVKSTIDGKEIPMQPYSVLGIACDGNRNLKFLVDDSLTFVRTREHNQILERNRDKVKERELDRNRGQDFER